MLLEEKVGGKRGDIGLLYVTPYSFAEVMQQAGAETNGELPANYVSQFDASKLNATTRKMLLTDKDGLEDVASRIRLSHISWAELSANCYKLTASLDRNSVGDQTLYRLLDGFAKAVEAHRGVGV